MKIFFLIDCIIITYIINLLIKIINKLLNYHNFNKIKVIYSPKFNKKTIGTYIKYKKLL